MHAATSATYLFVAALCLPSPESIKVGASASNAVLAPGDPDLKYTGQKPRVSLSLSYGFHLCPTERQELLSIGVINTPAAILNFDNEKLGTQMISSKRNYRLEPTS